MGENDDEKNSVLCSQKEETPVRTIVCVKRKEDMKRFEETEECFILDFDPSESLELSKLSLDNKNNPASASHNYDDDDADFCVVAEKGPCYCYVCNSAAPCKYWTQPLVPHCNADSADYWKEQRNMNKLASVEEAHY